MAITYTILTNSVKENRSNLVIEYAVPGGSNNAAVPWQTVVAELRAVEQANPGAATTSNHRRVTDGPYVAALDAGQILEVPLSVEYDANLSKAAKLAVLDAAAAAKLAEFTSEFASLYRFYGTSRTV